MPRSTCSAQVAYFLTQLVTIKTPGRRAAEEGAPENRAGAALRLDGTSGEFRSCAAACTHTSTCGAQSTHAAAHHAMGHRSADRTKPAPTHARESPAWVSMCIRVARASGKRGTARLRRPSEAAEAKGLCVALAYVSTLVPSAAASACQDRHRAELPAGRTRESGISRSHSFQGSRWVKAWPKGAWCRGAAGEHSNAAAWSPGLGVAVST